MYLCGLFAIIISIVLNIEEYLSQSRFSSSPLYSTINGAVRLAAQRASREAGGAVANEVPYFVHSKLPTGYRFNNQSTDCSLYYAPELRKFTENIEKKTK